MSFLAHLIEDVITTVAPGWLHRLSLAVITDARKHKHYSPTFATTQVASPAITKIQSTGVDAEFWALSTRFRVPVGGFQPAQGVKGLLMLEKPGHGGNLFRSRTYVKDSGKILTYKGYLSYGFEQNFSYIPTDPVPVTLDYINAHRVGYDGGLTPPGHIRLRNLALNVALKIGEGMALRIEEILRAKGLQVRTVVSPVVSP